MAEIEAGDDLIPARRWIRGHYTKLTKDNEARCNHCNAKVGIHIRHLKTLHKHLVEIHPDKLAEEEKNEVKFHWAWDYYIVKSNTEASCKLCKITVRHKNASNLVIHLKTHHGISAPTSDNVIYNENSSDDDMDTNKDIILSKTKRQEASSNLTNLSDSLYECAEGTDAINEVTPYNLIPIRRWMREHYTKLTRNRARCNHCNEKFSIHLSYLHSLHKHLVEAHPDKLAEEEKNEVKFHWIWDHYISENNRQATCERCKAIVIYYNLCDLKRHLKRIHKISGPTSDNVIDNQSSSDDDMDANKDITLRKAKHQEASSNSTNLSDSSYEYAEGTEKISEETPHNLIPIRRWMREHYTKLIRNNRARCNHCNEKFSIEIKRLSTLHKHLVEIHPDKLMVEEKNEVKFHWAWDYYIVKSNTEASCKLCKITVRHKNASNLIIHLKTHHGLLSPNSDSVINNASTSGCVMDANMNIAVRKAKRQKASSNSTNKSNNLYKYTEETGAINGEATDNVIPVRYWIREHYTKLTRSNEVTCNHCDVKLHIHVSKLIILHKHLIKAHPDKLTEEQKKEIKFHWIWDHYIAKSDRQAICERCKAIVKYYGLSELKRHLRIHKISGPTSDNIIDNGSSSDDMNANKNIALRKAKRQKVSFNSSNKSNNLYECTEERRAINREAADTFIPVRCWIREHYTKLTRNNEATCNHCNARFVIHITHLIILHKHLVEAHLDKLAEEQKKEIKFHWIWDYYIGKSDRQATCKRCKAIIKYYGLSELKSHLRRIHKISGPTSNNVTDNESSSGDDKDANKKRTVRKAKCQKTSSNSTNKSNNLYECTEEREAINRIFGPGSDNDMDNENNSDNYVDTDATIKNAKRQEDLSNSTRSCNNSYEEAGGTEDLNEVFGPGSDNDMDDENNSNNYVDAGTTIKIAKCQEDLSNSTDSCNNSYEESGGTDDLNEFAPNASNSMDHIMESLSDTDSAEYVTSCNSDDDLSFDEIFDLLRQE